MFIIFFPLSSDQEYLHGTSCLSQNLSCIWSTVSVIFVKKYEESLEECRKFSHLGCLRKQVRENYVVTCRNNLKDVVTITNSTMAVLAVPSVMYAGLPNGRYVNDVGNASNCFGLDLRQSFLDRFKVRVGCAIQEY